MYSGGANYWVLLLRGNELTSSSESTVQRLSKITAVPALALTLALATSGCASSGFERLPSLGVAELSGDVQFLRLRLESYYFEPSRLMVQVGVPVRLVLESGTLLSGHAFSLFAPNADLDLNAYVPARQQVTVQFVPKTTGEFAFYCNIDDHSDRGMAGTLAVVAELPGR